MIVDSNIEESLTFEDKNYLKGPRFISYFTLIVLLILFSIFAVEKIVNPGGMFFMEISILVSGFYFVSFIYRANQIIMP